MIVRTIEICPSCGQWDPWRKISSRYFNRGDVVCRVYVKCKRCGRAETVEYRRPEYPAQQKSS